jgi:hypothetical protein
LREAFASPETVASNKALRSFMACHIAAREASRASVFVTQALTRLSREKTCRIIAGLYGVKVMRRIIFRCAGSLFDAARTTRTL